MSLVKFHSQRRDIRLGAIAAIANGGVQPYPTFADDRVFDSRQSPYVMDGQTPLASVSVYTDTQKREPIQQTGEAPFMNTLEIIVELSLGGAGGKVEIDAELEAKLDVFEEQVLEALFSLENEGAQQFRTMFKRALSVTSMRLGNNESNTRLAMRDLMIVVEFDQRCKSLSQAFPRLDTLAMTATTGQGQMLTSDGTCDSSA